MGGWGEWACLGSGLEIVPQWELYVNGEPARRQLGAPPSSERRQPIPGAHWRGRRSPGFGQVILLTASIASCLLVPPSSNSGLPHLLATVPLGKPQVLSQGASPEGQS